MTALRPLVMRLHFYAGLFVAPLLLVAAFTGLAYTTMPQLEPIVHRDVLRVPASDVTLPLAEQVQAARAEHPEGALESVTPAPGATDSTRVVLAVDGLGDDYRRTVFVNPHTARVLGAETTYGQWLPVRTFFDELHRNLRLGAVGRFYSELAASWLWVVLLGGVVLWFSRRGRRRTVASRRDRLLRWHTTIGLIAVIGLVGLSITGMTWSRFAGATISDARAALTQEAPALDLGETGDGGGGEHAGHGGAGGSADGSGGEAERILALDQVVAAADLRPPVKVTLPTGPEGRYGVQENYRAWPERQDGAAVDGATGEVTDRVAFADWPLGAKLAEWGINAHMGLLFGLPNQIVLALLAIGLITMIVLGYRMWWVRGRDGRAGAAVPRGAWRKVGKPWLAVIAVATVVVAWAIPLLGASLLVFLLADVAVGAWRRRRKKVPV